MANIIILKLRLKIIKKIVILKKTGFKRQRHASSQGEIACNLGINEGRLK